MTDFHPELRRAAFLIPRFSIGARSARFANWLMRRDGPSPTPTIDGVAIHDEVITGPNAQSLRIRVYVPTDRNESEPRAAMIWIHGGGFIIGTAEQDEAHNIELCRSLNMVVASVDYRLALQAAYPAALNDCYLALQWLHDHASALNIASDRIAVGGNSAGAGLAAALALLAHDRKELRVAFQLLIYPMLDDRTTLRTDVDERKLRMWTTDSNQFAWQAYLSRHPGEDDVPDYAAPARRADLRGLPPAWIGVGTCDLFHDEDVEYARRLLAAGVACALKTVPGAFHGFEVAGLNKSVVREFREAYMQALRNALSVKQAAQR